MTESPTTLGIKLTNQSGDSLPHLTMAENEIGNRHSVVRIDVSCERGQSAVRHADGDRGHVLEIIRHGEQKDVHTAPLDCERAARCMCRRLNMFNG